jgi:hypothetical protein
MNITKFRKRFIFRDTEGEGSTGGGIDQAASAFQSILNPSAAPVETKAPEPVQQAKEPEPSQEVTQETGEESEEDIAARLAAEEETGDKTETPDDTITIQVDGKDVQIKKSELPELYKSGLRQADYTQKTMATAETRKTADAEIQQARTEREHYARELNNFLITNESLLREQEKVLTQELLNENPIEYLSQKRTFELRQAEVGKAQQELQRLQAQYQEEQAEARKNYDKEQLEKLYAKLPEWKDPVKAKADGEKIRDYMLANEFTPQEIGAAGDHRALLMVRKAMLYDNLMVKAKEAAKKVQAAPTMVERPGVPNQKTVDGRTVAMRDLKKNGGSIDAAANFFSKIL